MNLDDVLDQLARDPDADVDPAEVVLNLATDEYPNLDVDFYGRHLDELARDARPRLGDSFDARVDGLCRFLFHEVGFVGNQANYYDPRNSYLNDAIQRRTGIPITLSLIAMAVGRRLDLDIAGVALPGHFVVMANDGDERIVFDPFEGGRRLQAADCEALVRDAAGVEVPMPLEGLRAAPPAAIVARVLTNLKGCYLRTSDFRRAVRTIRRLRQIAPSDWSQARDLGACLLQDGRPGQAIDALELYLRELPDALDKEAVAKLVRQARSQVAKWN